mmetsp:Transcript_41026/g.128044  ORF Transcript_41026/g.128044 Transcript_41026/m.128044 type:complete len:294 (-) Transcript_41026:13-894(-)
MPLRLNAGYPLHSQRACLRGRRRGRQARRHCWWGWRGGHGQGGGRRNRAAGCATRNGLAGASMRLHMAPDTGAGVDQLVEPVSACVRCGLARAGTGRRGVLSQPPRRGRHRGGQAVATFLGRGSGDRLLALTAEADQLLPADQRVVPLAPCGLALLELLEAIPVLARHLVRNLLAGRLNLQVLLQTLRDLPTHGTRRAVKAKHAHALGHGETRRALSTHRPRRLRGNWCGATHDSHSLLHQQWRHSQLRPLRVLAAHQPCCGRLQAAGEGRVLQQPDHVHLGDRWGRRPSLRQ